MAKKVEVPEVGESVSSGIIAAWLKSNGDAVSEGDEIFELETDKATLAVPSPHSGILHIDVEEGAEVQVGQVVATIEESEGAATASASGESKTVDALSPAARRVVEEHGLDPASIQGSGKDGRITKEDAMKAAADSVKSQGAAPPAATPKSSGTEKSSSAAPAERSRQGAGSSASAPVPGRKGPPAPGAGQRRVTMTNLRKRIAANLVASKQGSAHLTTFNEVDMSGVMEIRARFKDAFEKRHGVKLGFMSFFVKAAQRALSRYPEVNAYVDGDEIVYNDFFDIGVALSSDRGLIVPVLRDVDAKSFADIESDILGFIERAREKRLSPDDLVGGTFTISNGGVFGSMLSTPIPNPPQTAALGMHSIQKRAVVIDDQIVIRPMMYLALTYDHRILDGREAIGFLKTIKELVEDPTQLLLDV